jgi:hypothetical protein
MSFTASGCLLSVRGGDVADDLEEIDQDRAGIGLASCHAQLKRLHVDERNGANAIASDLFDHEVRKYRDRLSGVNQRPQIIERDGSLARHGRIVLTKV